MKTTRLLSALILTACLGCGSMMAQNATQKVCPAKTEKTQKPKLTPEQRMEAQVQRMGKQLMLDDTKLAQFTSLYKEYLTALKNCRSTSEDNKVKPCERTDAQIQKDIEQRFETQQKMLDTQKKYYTSFKKILNARQLEKVFSTRRPCRMHKGNSPMMQHGKMGQPKPMPAPCCPNECPAGPQAPQNK